MCTNTFSRRLQRSDAVTPADYGVALWWGGGGGVIITVICIISFIVRFILVGFIIVVIIGYINVGTVVLVPHVKSDGVAERQSVHPVDHFLRKRKRRELLEI